MKHVAAYLLAVLGGNANPSADDIKTILSSVDVQADDQKLSKLIEELKGKNLEELIEAGKSKLSAVPTGGAAAPAAAASTGAAAPAATTAAAAAPPPEEKEESEEMGFDLFG